MTTIGGTNSAPIRPVQSPTPNRWPLAPPPPPPAPKTPSCIQASPAGLSYRPSPTYPQLVPPPGKFRARLRPRSPLPRPQVKEPTTLHPATSHRVRLPRVRIRSSRPGRWRCLKSRSRIWRWRSRRSIRGGRLRRRSIEGVLRFRRRWWCGMDGSRGGTGLGLEVREAIHWQRKRTSSHRGECEV